MTDDIYTKIERYSNLGFGIDLAKQQKQALIDSVIPQEVKDKLAEIDAEFGGKLEQLEVERELLEAEIKQVVLEAGRSIKGAHHTFSWTKGRVSWNTKALDGYAAAHPEILQFRKEGSPSVSVRKA